ncbi:hypothetical protein [Streptomyces bohaiensis]|uniref:hypothetical protein n=1 Tax=Streptomyces bohaiensis TaxID=1431344 RepID=UPI003B7E448F
MICPQCVDAGREPEGELVMVAVVEQMSGPGYTLWACTEHAGRTDAEPTPRPAPER